MVAVSRNASKKHYYMNSLVVGLSVRNNNNYGLYCSFSVYVYDSNGGLITNVTTYDQPPAVGAGQTVSTSYTFTGTSALEDSATVNANGETSGMSASATSATITYGAKADPSISSSFKGGYLRPDTSKTITFTSNKINNIYEQYTVSSGVFYYKLSSAGAYTSISFSGSSVTIPANTLTTGNTYNAYADITVDDGTVVTVTMSNISTVDAVPTVTALSPVNTVVYGEADFSWSYSISTGTAQYAVDIQTSTDGSTYTDLISHEVQSTTTYSATISTSGTIYWKVRAYNQDNVASAWSTAVTFVNNIPPNAPTITGVTTTGMPTVTWNASDQIAYQVRFLNGSEVVQDSGAVYSAGKSYTSDEYLPDNATYTVQVRIYNTFGKVSDWAEAQYTQSGSLTAPVFTLSGSNNGAVISITTDPSVSTYYIKRNGQTIGTADNGTYVDRFANGTVTYTVIAVDANGNTGQTTKTITFSVKSNMLIAEDGTVYLINKRINSPVGVTKQITMNYDTAMFLGAELPEINFAKGRQARFSVTFYDDVSSENLLGKTMYYCDMHGNSAWVAVVSIGRTENRFGNESVAELQVTSKNEVIQYA